MKKVFIFSGIKSKRLWKDINSIEDECIHKAIYHLGCKCQELEEIVRDLETKQCSICGGNLIETTGSTYCPKAGLHQKPQPDMPLIELPDEIIGTSRAHFMNGAKRQRDADMACLPAHDAEVRKATIVPIKSLICRALEAVTRGDLKGAADILRRSRVMAEEVR